MIVITLSKVPMSLRGDLTKWCQEVQTGVYVGNFSARIRDLLWERITSRLETVKQRLSIVLIMNLAIHSELHEKTKKLLILMDYHSSSI